MTFQIITLGCKVNLYESEYIKSDFIEKGYKEVSLKEKADIIIINTCSVTNQSDSKSRQIINTSRKKNKDSILVVCGCSSENKKEELLKLDVDILIGTKDKSKLTEYVSEFKKTKKPIVKFYDINNSEFEDMFINDFKKRTRAFVKIQDGCDNYCSYCIIPYMRGNLKSKDFNKAVDEIKTLTEHGFKEVVLTGIHTGSYGRGEDFTLTKLIKEISKIDKLKRIRISSIEVTELTNEFLNELENNSKICNHMHIPLQSGNDKTLEDMNRKYKTKEYLSKIKKIRSIRENISITTDVIVGFPTETEKDFEKTYQFIKKVGFTKIHVFPYSKREHTKAALLEPVFDDLVKKERVTKLLSLSKDLENNYYKENIGKTLEVLIERTSDNISSGYTENYIRVTINESLEKNKIYKGEIISVNGLLVTMKIVE